MSNELTFFDRRRLQFWFRTKLSLRKIARLIRKDHSVAIREIQRNSSGRDEYRADMAQRLCEERKSKKKKENWINIRNLKNMLNPDY